MNESINCATGYGRGTIAYSSTSNYHNNSHVANARSYFSESKAELSHFKKLNPNASLFGLAVKGFCKVIDIAVIAPLKLVHRLLF